MITRTPTLLAGGFAIVAVPRGDWNLRSARLPGFPATPRDRDSHGARRRIGQHLRPGASGRHMIVLLGAAVGLAGPFLLRQTIQGTAVRSGRDGPSNRRRGVAVLLAGGGAGRVPAAGAARRADHHDRAHRPVSPFGDSLPPWAVLVGVVFDRSPVSSPPDAARDNCRYRIVSRLGAGGMGEVYLAQRSDARPACRDQGLARAVRLRRNRPAAAR